MLALLHTLVHMGMLTMGMLQSTCPDLVFFSKSLSCFAVPLKPLYLLYPLHLLLRADQARCRDCQEAAEVHVAAGIHEVSFIRSYWVICS